MHIGLLEDFTVIMIVIYCYFFAFSISFYQKLIIKSTTAKWSWKLSIANFKWTSSPQSPSTFFYRKYRVQNALFNFAIGKAFVTVFEALQS